MAPIAKVIAGACLIVSTVSTTAMADMYQHIDRLACEVARQGELLVAETKHYRSTRDYRHLVNDAREICRLSNHIHVLAERRGSLVQLERDVRELGAKHHHIRGLFDAIEYRASRGQGRIRGNTAHVQRLLNAMDRDIRFLCEGIRILQAANHTVLRPPIAVTPGFATPYNEAFTIDRSRYRNGYGISSSRSQQRAGFGRPVHDVHRSQYRAPGITIGGGSSRFTIRF